MRIAEVARSAGCSVQQVRKLEALGVIPTASRTRSGYRIFTHAHVANLVAYRELAIATGPARARALMQTLHADVRVFLAELDATHAGLTAQRDRLAALRQALTQIADEPLGERQVGDELTIGELALALDLPTSTLRHWETEGLLRPRRTRENQRRYDPHDVRDARLIQQLRQAGQNITALRELLPQLRSQANAEPLLASRKAVLDNCSRALIRATAAIATDPNQDWTTH